MTATQRSWWLAIALVIATFAGSAYIYSYPARQNADPLEYQG